MVNERARDRSARRGALGYLPVMSALGVQRAVAGRLITIDVLRAWRAPNVELRDAAVGIALTELARAYFDAQLPAIAETMTPGAGRSTTRLREIAAHAARNVDAWQRRLPALESMTAAEVVATIEDVL
jgi:hypothetical protein